MAESFPALDEGHLHAIDLESLRPPFSTHKPRILILYGSLREVSYSRLLAHEARRLLERLGCEVRMFDPKGLPLPDEAPASHPKVQELRELSEWSEGQVWVSPERHGAMTGIMKAQIDWIPLSLGSIRPTQGRTLAVMEVSGGSQSFNAVNQMRILGRWMRMITIPNQGVSGSSLSGIRCGRQDEAFLLLRPCRGCLRGTGEVHDTHERRVFLSDGPL